jgi:phage protein D
MPAPAVYVPIPVITIDGTVDRALAGDVRSVLVEETTDGLYRCEATFDNYGARRAGIGYRYFDRQAVEFGKQIAIELGAGERARRVFDGRITAFEGVFPPEGGAQLVVLAEDRLQDLRMTRRSRTFENVTDADAISTIASEHGLSPDVRVSGPTHRVLAQWQQSDLAFVRERACRLGAEVWMEGTTLHVVRRTDRAAGPVDLEYGVNLRWLTIRADLAHQRSEVGVSGWDVAAKEAIEETVGDDALRSELGRDESGAAILARAFAPRRERIVDAAPATAEEARAIAEASFHQRARRFVSGTGLADGDGRIRVGGIVNLVDVGRPFEGAYYVTRVRHTYDGLRGFLTELDVERAGLGQAES